MSEHMQEVVGFLMFFVVAALFTHISILIEIAMKPKKRRSAYDVGSVLKPKPDLQTTYDPTDIRALASAVHNAKEI